MKLEPLGERLIVDEYQSNQEDYLIYLIHIVTYKFSLNYIHNKKVLDYGCGSGYGTALISKHCFEATGIDISPDAIAYAKKHYTSPNVSFLTVNEAEDAPIPFPDETFDVVLSFQVIEHIRNTSSYLKEIDRVLKPGGRLIIATPDRSSRLFPFQKPWNMWHVREYSQQQLYDTLAEYFSQINVQQIGGQKDVLAIELNRTRKLKWITFPFTLPFISEIIRVNCLRLLKLLNQKFAYDKSHSLFDYDESALSISDNEKFSIDLIAVAKKKS